MTTHAVRVFQPPRNSGNTCARIVKLGSTFWIDPTVNQETKSKPEEITSMTSDLPRVIKRVQRLQVGSS